MHIDRVTPDQVQAVTTTSFVSTMTLILFGYSSASISGAVGAIEHNFIAPRGLTETASSVLVGLAVCSLLVGTIVGSLLARRVSDRFGRRWPLMIAAILFLISGLGSGFPEIGLSACGLSADDALWPFVAYRLVGGIAVGFSSVVGPMHLTEFAPSAMRGQLAALQSIAAIGGMTLALIVNWCIAIQGSGDWVYVTGWRYMLSAPVVLAIVVLLVTFFVPESPMWLARRGRLAEAKRVLLRWADPDQVDAKIAEWNKSAQTPVTALKLSRRMVLGCLALGMLQLTGVNAIAYYGPLILERLGFRQDAALLGAFAARAVALLATMIVVQRLERINRRATLVISALLMAACMLVTGASLDGHGTQLLGVVAVAGYLGIVGVAYAIFPVILSEAFPIAIRGQAIAFAISAQWIGNFVVSFAFPIVFGTKALRGFGSESTAFIFFAHCALLTAFAVRLLIPEARSMSEDELMRHWKFRRVLAR